MTDDTTMRITPLPQVYHNCKRWALTYRGRTARIQEAPDHGGPRLYYVDLPAQRKGVCMCKTVEGFLSAQLAALELIDKLLERSHGQTKTPTKAALGAISVAGDSDP